MKGYELYCRAYALMPIAAPEAAEKLGATLMQTSRLYRRMRALGIAHKQGYKKTRGRPIVYGAGGQPVSGLTTKKGAMLVNFAYVLKAMTGRTVDEIETETGVRADSVRRIVRGLRQEGRVHISGWTKKHQATVAEWTLGRGKDVERPQRITRAEQNRQAWQRRKERLRQLAIQNALNGRAEARIKTAAGMKPSSAFVF